jgi:tetratricopeptide (TPR) repeat protein
MSRTLSLVDHLFTRSQLLQQLGRSSEALDFLEHVNGLRCQPAESAAETQMQLAQLYLKCKRFVRARHVLGLALKHQPNDARLHYLQATACASGKHADLVLALKHYHRSLKIKPNDATCLAACGLVEIRQGKVKKGLEHCRRAWEQAPDSLVIIKKMIMGFRLAEQPDEARKLLMAARFRNPNSAKIRHLWDRFQFHETRRCQQLSRKQSATQNEPREPLILSFATGKARNDAAMESQRKCRQDKPEEMSAPRISLRVSKPDQRHAQ